MILDIDIGNSRCKWRLQDASKNALLSGSCRLEGLWRHEFPRVEHDPIRRVRVACVRGEAVNSEVRAWCSRQFHVEAEFAIAETCKGGVTNGYRNPGKLGIDRWLAILAAFAEARAGLCVIDCGSAITADFVDEHGHHLGGFIAPGLNMMRESLLRGTGQVKFEPIQSVLELTPGTTTRHAVAAGTTQMAIGLIKQSVELNTQVINSARIFFTGGDGGAFHRVLELPGVLRPELVIDGLAIALP